MVYQIDYSRIAKQHSQPRCGLPDPPPGRRNRRPLPVPVIHPATRQIRVAPRRHRVKAELLPVGFILVSIFSCNRQL